MPGEVIVRTGPVTEKEVAWSEETGGWVDLVRPAVAGSSSLGSQVVNQVVAQAVGSVPYTVQSGDTLWSIAEQLYGDGGRWQEIVGFNPQLQSPDMIYAGQVLNLSGEPAIRTPVVGATIREWDFSDPREGGALTSLPTLTDDGFCAGPMGCQSSEAGSSISSAQRVQQYDSMMVSKPADAAGVAVQ